MVSFSCESCGDVLTKKKLDQHRGRCHLATFTCIDCMVHFQGTDYRTHTNCITEDQKYQGAHYKGKKQRGVNGRPNTRPHSEPPAAGTGHGHARAHALAHGHAHHVPDTMIPAPAYVEDAPEEYQSCCGGHSHGHSPPTVPPEAPMPPPAMPEHIPVNVFDFLVETTPVPARSYLPAPDDGQLVTFDYEPNAYIDPEGYMADYDYDALVQYGAGPVPTGPAPLQTPAPKPARKTSPKKDKKRKRPHLEINNDQVMTDAPPVVLHSGLTGSLGRMMHFPPSPELSGDNNNAEALPASPTKKVKHKHSKSKSTSSTGGGLLTALISGAIASKSKKRKVAAKKRTGSTSSSSSANNKHRRVSDGSASSKDGPGAKLIEYRRPGSRESQGAGQMVLYQPHADLFLSLVTKGPESERGCSVNKALKRFHRECSTARDGAAGAAPSRLTDEKELWRSLRMRKNDRGEIVLFALEDER